MRHPARRRALAALATASVIALVGCAADVGSTDPATDASESELSGQIIWADYGGATHDARWDAYFESFVAETGVEIISASQEQAIMFEMLGGGAGDYDVMHVGLTDIYRSHDGILPLYDDVPRDDQLPEDAQDYGFGTFIIGHVQGYLPDTFPDGGPETWADFWDTETYPGMRAWPGSAGMFGSIIEVALLADGVEPDELYPLDVDRALDKISELRDDLVFYTSWPEIQQLLTSGTVSVAYGPTGQFTGLITQEIDVTISWNQAIVNTNLMTIPLEAPNAENIMALARWMADPERQARFAELTYYGPGSSAAFDYIPDDIAELIVTAPSHTEVVYANESERALVYDEILEKYGVWLTEG